MARKPDHPADMKIFPRNLTARADYVVRGNPVVSRPESGADNSHPGLEFDIRRLDRGFFPGLSFDFDFGFGARLVDVQAEWLSFEDARDLKKCLDDEGGQFFLWYLFGRFGDRRDGWVFADLYARDGYEVIRKVHDLEPGPLVVIVGRHQDDLDVKKMRDWVREVVKLRKLTQSLQAGNKPANLKPMVQSFRDGERNIQFAVFIGERAKYLDDEGVIDLQTAPPGTLTQSLCSPWQWDFADCGCYYWAASRPDIVTSADGKRKNLNFLRRDRDGDTSPKVEDTLKWADWMDDRRIISQPTMIREWETLLPVVVDDREATHYERHKVTSIEKKWSLATIVGQLRHLASVEHALCDCYLYAHYSVNVPEVAKEIREVAIDEMRHFRWVNEALVLLGERPSFDRARWLSKLPAGSKLTQHQTELKLEGLTPATLKRFISIEEPSAAYGADHISGLYTHILLCLEELDDPKLGRDVRQKVMEIIKLIIDEGTDHYHRFLLIQRTLKRDTRRSYLRFAKPPRKQNPKSEVGKLQILGDHYYQVILETLRRAFEDAPDKRGGMLGQAQRLMHNLDDVGQLLAMKRQGLLFTVGRSSARGTTSPHTVRNIMARSVPSVLVDLKSSNSGRVRDIAEKHELTALELARFYRKAMES